MAPENCGQSSVKAAKGMEAFGTPMKRNKKVVVLLVEMDQRNGAVSLILDR